MDGEIGTMFEGHLSPHRFGPAKACDHYQVDIQYVLKFKSITISNTQCWVLEGGVSWNNSGRPTIKDAIYVYGILERVGYLSHPYLHKRTNEWTF